MPHAAYAALALFNTIFLAFSDFLASPAVPLAAPININEFPDFRTLQAPGGSNQALPPDGIEASRAEMIDSRGRARALHPLLLQNSMCSMRSLVAVAAPPTPQSRVIGIIVLQMHIYFVVD